MSPITLSKAFSFINTVKYTYRHASNEIPEHLVICRWARNRRLKQVQRSRFSDSEIVFDTCRFLYMGGNDLHRFYVGQNQSRVMFKKYSGQDSAVKKQLLHEVLNFNICFNYSVCGCPNLLIFFLCLIPLSAFIQVSCRKIIVF